MLESQFQSKLIKELKETFPGIEIMKQDASYRQGQPDLVLFQGPRYAMLECKRSKDAPHRPNQDYYINKYGSMSFASFVYPENKDEVITKLKGWFKEDE